MQIQVEQPAPTEAAPPPAESLTVPSAAVEVPETDPLVGQMVGSFRILSLLGTGGMGAVYLAEHPVIGNRVAVKFLHDSLAQNPDTVFRFYQEARAAHVVGHENIVSIYDLNRLPPKRYYLVMEHLDGETLSDRLANGAMAPEAALPILLQLCDALQAAHEAGVVHRDLKPDNIFLVERRGQKDFVKVVDFGIAKLREAGPERTNPGTLIGTPDYMAPEQCEGAAVDARADIYALGVIAYRMATGCLPFARSTVTQVLLAHLEEEPEAPRSINPQVNATFEKTILRALRKQPKDRFQTMRAFRDALLAVRDAQRARTPTPGKLTPPPGRALVEVQQRGAPNRRLPAAHLTDSAVFLCDPMPPPPLFTRVTVSIPHVSGPMRLEGEVVRHVTPLEARSFGGSPGFAVQFLKLDEARSLFDGEESSAAGTLIAKYRDAANHYDLLGLPWDVEFPDVASRARCVRKEVEAAKERRGSPRQRAELEALLLRIDDAAATLGNLEKRLHYDAGLGNFLGIERSMRAGFPLVRLDELQFEFRKARPDLEARIEQHKARIRLASALGNEAGAIEECEQALKLHPLCRELHETYAALRRRGRRL